MNYYVSTIAVMTKNRIIDWYGNANEYADIDVFENQYACIELVNPRYKKRHVQMMMNLNGSPMPTDEMASDFVSYSVLPEIAERNPKFFALIEQHLSLAGGALMGISVQKPIWDNTIVHAA